MESSFPTLQYSSRIFNLVCKLFKVLFQPLCESVNCMNCVFESQNMSLKCPVINKMYINLYLRPCSIAIYGKLYLYYLYHFKLFFWSVNCENIVHKLCNTFWKCQHTQTLLILECIFGKFDSNFSALFLTLLLSGLQILQVIFLVLFCQSVNCMS